MFEGVGRDILATGVGGGVDRDVEGVGHIRGGSTRLWWAGGGRGDFGPSARRMESEVEYRGWVITEFIMESLSSCLRTARTLPSTVVVKHRRFLLLQ
eukprot:751126-Hanusia_phi.AAC.4